MSQPRPDGRLHLTDFSGGFRDTPESNLLPPHASPEGLNGFFDAVQYEPRRATLRKRQGCRMVNPTAMALGEAVGALAEFRREDADPALVAVCDEAIYRYDDDETFDAVTGGTGFTNGTQARTLNVHNNLLVMDGAQVKRYNGTDVWPIGFAAPTGAPGLATAAGPGVTGTYEGFAVWYDSVEDHESSWSPISTAVVFANQARVWTKPAGSPPANVDFWRVYARRVDADQVGYYRVGTVAIGTATLTETISDDARTDLPQSKEPTSNNPPTTAFAFMESFAGYTIGVGVDSSSLEVSGFNDYQSWHPRDVFPVQRDGDPVRAVKRFSTTCLVFKAKKTFRLVGDRLPFTIEPLHSNWGLVGQDAGIEVDQRFYGWDESRGPYVTDTLSWQSLASGRIQGVVDAVHRGFAGDIRVGHDEIHNLICWIVPTTVARKRTMICYHYLLDTWLWPITGLEYASLTSFRATDGSIGLYVGDWWGRVYKMFDTELDGAPALSTYQATVTAATGSTVTASGATFYTDGDGLAGLRVAVESPTGVWQFRRIASNTATTITLDTVHDATWTYTPAAGWTVYIGPIEWYWRSPWFEMGAFDERKDAPTLAIQAKTTSEAAIVTVEVRLEDSSAVRDTLTFQFAATGAIWDISLWDVASWGETGGRSASRKRIDSNFFSLQLGIWNYKPQELVRIVQLALGVDALPRKKVAGLA